MLANLWRVVVILSVLVGTPLAFLLLWEVIWPELSRWQRRRRIVKPQQRQVDAAYIHAVMHHNYRPRSLSEPFVNDHAGTVMPVADRRP